MKILIFSTHFYPYTGGLENYILIMAQELIELGHEVTVVCLKHDNSKSHEVYKNINIYRLDSFNILGEVYSIPKLSKNNKSIFKKLKQEKYDVVNTHTRFFTTSYIGMRFSKKNNIRHIHTEHGNKFVTHPNKIIQIMAYLYDMTFGKMVIRHADAVIGISQKCVDFAKKLGAKTTVNIPNSIDTQYFSQISKTEHGGINITFIGRLIHAKGVQDLINALKETNTNLYIAGDGPYKKELVRLSKQNSVKTTFLGNIQKSEVRKLLSKTDIFVNPSYSEGLPTSVLEAGSIGCAVIATDVGGTGEIIDNNINGLLIQPKDIPNLTHVITQLVDNKLLRDKFGNDLQNKIIQKFNFKNNITNIEKVFKE